MVFVQDADWERWTPLSEVYDLNGKPIHNGMFGEPKDAICEKLCGLQVNNESCTGQQIESQFGSGRMYPSFHNRLGATGVGRGGSLVLSSEDIRCFFYLFAAPWSWHKFMSFSKQARLNPIFWQVECCLWDFSVVWP